MHSAGYKKIAALHEQQAVLNVFLAQSLNAPLLTAPDVVSQRGLRTMMALRRGGRDFRERAPTHYYNVP